MITIMSRDSARGKEYTFRFNGKLFVFKTKQEAQVKLTELENGNLFQCQ